jgi:hypothetical protein
MMPTSRAKKDMPMKGIMRRDVKTLRVGSMGMRPTGAEPMNPELRDPVANQRSEH